MSADGARFAAFRARATAPTGAGIVVFPDVRGLHPYYEELALRFAEHGVDAIAIDYFGRTAFDDPRDDTFEYMPHVVQTKLEALALGYAGSERTIRRAVAEAKAAYRTGRLPKIHRQGLPQRGSSIVAFDRGGAIHTKPLSPGPDKDRRNRDRASQRR